MKIEERLEHYQAFFQHPVSLQARILLLLAALLLPVAFQFPLWTMSFESNQYPDPLRLAIYVNQLEGQKTVQRDDLREINSLNHYIGMRPLLESDFSEFLWMPFVLGFFGLILLRAVVFGNLRDLVDITVLLIYFSLFSFWNFYHRLYQYGHNLNPEAAIKVEPFTPPLYGREKVANFWVESFPGQGSYALVLFGLLILAALALTVWKTRRIEAAT